MRVCVCVCRALYLSLPLTLVLQTLVCVVGLVIYACYGHCDPYVMGLVRARDQVSGQHALPTLPLSNRPDTHTQTHKLSLSLSLMSQA